MLQRGLDEPQFIETFSAEAKHLRCLFEFGKYKADLDLNINWYIQFNCYRCVNINILAPCFD